MSAVTQIDPHASAPPPITAPGAVPRLGVELRPRARGLDVPARTRGRAGRAGRRPDRARRHRHAGVVTGAEYAVAVRAAAGRPGDAPRARGLPAPGAHRAARAVADARRDLGRRDGRDDLGRGRLGGTEPGPGDRLDLAVRRSCCWPARAAGSPWRAARRASRAWRGKPTLIVGAGVVGADDRPAARRPAGVRPAPGRLPRRATRPPTERERERQRQRQRAPHRCCPCSARPPTSPRSPPTHSAEHVIFAFTSEPRPAPAGPGAPLRAARAGGLAGAAPVRVDERPGGARLGRQPAGAGHPPAGPQGLAVPASSTRSTGRSRCSA